MNKLLRLQHRRRIGKRLLHVYHCKPISQLLEEMSQSHIAKLINVYGNTRKVCSCYMCGNPRRRWKQRTLAEIKQSIRDKDDY